jgi:head-tail adaptor
MSIGEFRNRVRIKQNVPADDGAGGQTDNIVPYDPEEGAFELWAKVEPKSGRRTDENGRTNMERVYKITTRATFGYTPERQPRKNMLVEIMGRSSTDLVIQSVIWDDWSEYWVIEAVEKL